MLTQTILFCLIALNNPYVDPSTVSPCLDQVADCEDSDGVEACMTDFGDGPVFLPAVDLIELKKRFGDDL